MKIKKVMMGLSGLLGLLVLATNPGFAGPGTPAVSVTGGPSAVTIPANASSPTALTPAFTLVNSNTAYPVALTSVTFTSSSNYIVTSPILLTGCSYNGQPAIPASGQGTCTATVQLTGTNPTSSPVSGILTVVTSAGTAKSLPVSITVAGSSSPATWTLDANSINPSQPISVGDTVTAQYTLANTDNTNSLTFSDPVAGFSGTAGVLSNEQILSSGSNNCESLSGTLPAGQSCVYLVQATGAAAGTANITLDVTTNGTGGPTSPVPSAPITVQAPVVNPAWTLTTISTKPMSIPENGSVDSTVVYELTNTDTSTALTLSSASVVASNPLISVSLEAYTGSSGPGCTNGMNLGAGDSCYYQVNATALNAGAGTAQTELTVFTSNGNPLSNPTPALSAPINIFTGTVPANDWSVGAGAPATLSFLSGATGQTISFTVTNSDPSTPLVIESATATGTTSDVGASVAAPNCSSVSSTKSSRSSSLVPSETAGVVQPNGGTCTYTVTITGTNTGITNETANIGLSVQSANGGSTPKVGAASTITVEPATTNLPAWTLTANPSVNQNSTTGELTEWFQVTNESTTTPLLLDNSKAVASSNQQSSFWSSAPRTINSGTGSSEPNCATLTAPLPAAGNGTNTCEYIVVATPASTSSSNNVTLSLTAFAAGTPPSLLATSPSVSVGSSSGGGVLNVVAGTPSQSSLEIGDLATILYTVTNTSSNAVILQNAAVSTEAPTDLNAQINAIDSSSTCVNGLSLAPTTGACTYLVDVIGVQADSNPIPVTLTVSGYDTTKAPVNGAGDSTGIIVTNTPNWSIDHPAMTGNSMFSGIAEALTYTITYTGTSSLSITKVPYYDTTSSTTVNPPSASAGGANGFNLSVDSTIDATTCTDSTVLTPTNPFCTVVINVTPTLTYSPLQGVVVSFPVQVTGGSPGQFIATSAPFDVSAATWSATAVTPLGTMLVPGGAEISGTYQIENLSSDPLTLGSTPCNFGVTASSTTTPPSSLSDFSYDTTTGSTCTASESLNNGDSCLCKINISALSSAVDGEAVTVALTAQAAPAAGQGPSAIGLPAQVVTVTNSIAPLTFAASPVIQILPDPTNPSSTITNSMYTNMAQTLTYTLQNSNTYPVAISPPALDVQEGSTLVSTNGSSSATYPAVITNDCDSLVAANSTCHVSVTLRTNGVLTTTPLTMTLSIPTSASSTPLSPVDAITLNVIQAPASYGGTQPSPPVSGSRTITFINNCASGSSDPYSTIWLGIAGASPSALGSTAPANCTTNNDCPVGASCVASGGAAGPLACFWNAPLPIGSAGKSSDGGPSYVLTSGSSLSVELPYVSGQNPTFLNNAGAVWNGTATARLGCTLGSAGCTVADCSGAGLYPVDGMCAPWKGFSTPSTLAEPYLTNGNMASGTGSLTDFYDVSLVNGYSIPVSIVPDTPPPNPTTLPYNCGSPGISTDQGSAANNTPIGGCSWNFSNASMWPDSWNGVQSAARVQTYLTKVETPLGDSVTYCTANSQCTSAGQVCGLATQQIDYPSGPGASPLTQCGTYAGVWSLGSICAENAGKSGKLGNPFNCNGSAPGQAEGGGAVPTTLSQWYQCADTAPALQSCYGTFSDKTTPGNQQCCGCANWGDAATPQLEGKEPTPGLGVVDSCAGQTSYWMTNALPVYAAMKQACPSAYSYQFDDGTSTFTCGQSWNSVPTNPNATNYTITFCPAGSSQAMGKVALKSNATERAASGRSASGSVVSTAVSKLKSLGTWSTEDSNQ